MPRLAIPFDMNSEMIEPLKPMIAEYTNRAFRLRSTPFCASQAIKAEQAEGNANNHQDGGIRE